MRNSRSQLAQPAVPVRNIRSVVLGDISFKTWYPSFYPEALVGKELETLFICKSCFAYANDVHAYLGHCQVCPLAESPPGRLIYTKDDISIYEIDGEEEKLFAQNLSLFAKLFLDNKSVFFDVVGFHYYLLTTSLPPIGNTADPASVPDGPDKSHLPSANTLSSHAPSQQQIVGFFSKEKLSWDLNNLACILVFPPWQRRRLGKILMGCSYSLGAREGRIGGPEKPLSELGRRGYLTFWQARVAAAILGDDAKELETTSTIPVPSTPTEVVTVASSASSRPKRRAGPTSKAAAAAAAAAAIQNSTPAKKKKKGAAGHSTATMEVAELAERCDMVVDDVITALREMALCERKKNGDVIVNKAKVKDWAVRTRADLRPPIDEKAFIWGDEDDDEEEGEEGENGEEREDGSEMDER